MLIMSRPELLNMNTPEPMPRAEAIGSHVNLDELQHLRERGLAVVSQHPELPISVYNYTGRFPIKDRDWTPLLEVCRGLIIDESGRILSRPFSRMQELKDSEQLPDGSFVAYTKLDGSMGVQYDTPEGPRMATRGSFTGRQAIRGSQLLEQYRDYAFEPGTTPVWEIIYPENRLVVDYGDRNEIVMTGLINTATGEERPLPNQSDVPFPVVDSITGLRSADELRALEAPNAEGFVVRMDETGERIKVKFPAFEYLASIRKGTMNYRTWRHVSQGGLVEEYLETIPGGARNGVATIAANLQAQYEEIEQQAHAAAVDETIPVDEKLAPIVQRIREGKAFPQQYAWELIRPERNPHRTAIQRRNKPTQ